MINWTHSNGPDNKNPLYDIGGPASAFDISEVSMNNLFNNITPDQAIDGITDYRCFYILNNLQDETLKDIVLNLSSADDCGVMTLGSKIQNDEQQIAILGVPEVNGYIILGTEFHGPTVTCYYDGSWSNFAVELEENLRLIPYCDEITVVLTASSFDYALFKVTFLGDVKNREVRLIYLVQNNLVSIRGNEYRVAAFSISDNFNHKGNSKVKVSIVISNDYPASGIIYVINIITGLYVPLHYTSYSGQIFNLQSPLAFDLIHGDEVWINVTPESSSSAYPPSSVVNITKIADGWPINQDAFRIDRVTDQPDYTNLGTSFDVGMLRPQEGFFVWIKRVVDAGTSGCEGDFSLFLSSESEPYPPE